MSNSQNLTIEFSGSDSPEDTAYKMLRYNYQRLGVSHPLDLNFLGYINIHSKFVELVEEQRVLRENKEDKFRTFRYHSGFIISYHEVNGYDRTLRTTVAKELYDSYTQAFTKLDQENIDDGSCFGPNYKSLDDLEN